MFSLEGFLGTSAPFYLDLATVYFAFLPFLMAFSIYFAVKKEYKKHFISQAIILGTTLVIVVIFEIGTAAPKKNEKNVFHGIKYRLNHFRYKNLDNYRRFSA